MKRLDCLDGFYTKMLLILCVCVLGEDYRTFKGPKGERRQRTSGRSGVVQEGEQGPKGEGQQPADRTNRERGQWLE